jgi:hypothetical protein
MYGIGKDPLCFWIADANKFYGMPEEMRKIKDYRFCVLSKGEYCPVVKETDECWFPKARRMGREFDPKTMKWE